MIENPEKDSINFFTPQKKFEWYRVNSLLHELALSGEQIGLRPEDIVHLGGTALYYRCSQVFGPMAVFNFRGTKDMDLLSFRRGSVQRVLSSLGYGAQIKNYQIKPSHGLPNKKSISIKLRYTEAVYPPEREIFEIDLYESEFDNIRFNNRVMYENQIVLDPPEQLRIPFHKGLISVPSIRDAFVIKMDIVDYSASGLRPKDCLDILTTLKLADSVGISFDEILKAVTGTSTLRSNLKKLDSLEELFTNPKRNLNLPKDYVFMPTDDQLYQAIKDVRRFRDYEIYGDNSSPYI